MNTIEPRGGIVTTGDCKGSFFEGVHEDVRMWYLDFFTDSGTASLGHGSVYHLDARSRGAGQSLHTLNLFDNELRNRIAEKVCRVVGYDKIFFCNSGTEAIEAAIKLARKYQYDKPWFELQGRSKDQIWSIKDAFHGRTYGALAASDGPNYHFDGFGPFPESFVFQEIDEINFDLAAAVIISPVFGNNDVRVYDIRWLEKLKMMCNQNDTLLIFDEVQTGSGRTGDITYAKLIGIQPDIMALAKGFGMGFPVAATLANNRVAQSFTPGTHFSTFAGSPPALYHVEVMFDWLDNNLSKVRKMGQRMMYDLAQKNWVKTPRGIGMFIAFEINGDAKKFSMRCLDKGLVIGAFRSNPVKITPPLNLSDEEWEIGLRIMDRVAKEMQL
jgi:acetylornithine/N-succinyldiaminopimelate aminotransferase